MMASNVLVLNNPDDGIVVFQLPDDEETVAAVAKKVWQKDADSFRSVSAIDEANTWWDDDNINGQIAWLDGCRITYEAIRTMPLDEGGKE